MKDFKAFLLRGNLVDLAVAVVIGVAFGAVVTALVGDLITPLIAALAGKQDFSGLAFTINHSRFRYGDFIDALLSFAVVASAVFFLVVRPMNALVARRHKDEPATKPCPHCLSEIPRAATVCAFCTRDVQPASG
ncbi:MAG: large conductance mechanosensitive channel protein MscL [Acidobacteriota bacterium]|nr:large conductance mechanosensitive channel protein MscL [Acidobacteriota bacterium]